MAAPGCIPEHSGRNHAETGPARGLPPSSGDGFRTEEVSAGAVPWGQAAADAGQLRAAAPRIHCITNAVTMQDVANILLAAGGSAIMASDVSEVEEISTLCRGTLLNTGTPSLERFAACALAGARAARLGHPVVLDPVGAGASRFRREQLKLLLGRVHPDLIRCNLEEAVTLLALAGEDEGPDSHGGVESGIDADDRTRLAIAGRLSRALRTTVLISGSADAVSDGVHFALVSGGDARMQSLTGSGCMLSALCAAFLAAGIPAFSAAKNASLLWKRAAEYAARHTRRSCAGIGSFHAALFDAVGLASAKIPPSALRLYAVSDRSRLRAGESLDSLLPALFENGVTCFQLREKELAEPQLLEEAQRLLPICRSFGIPFILNDNVAVARQIGADGVHVGLSDMGIARAREILGPNAIIGGSAHSVSEALAAEQAGADYLGCGAVFGSTTKADATELSPEELAAICRAVHIPVVAIGGITGQNLTELAGSGIAGPAVVSALFAQPDPAAAAKRLRALSDALFG